MIKFNWVFKLSALSMLSLVGFGAVYGHKGRLDEEGVHYFNKAQIYHLTNNVGLLATSLVTPGTVPFSIALASFIGGIAVFVLPLYYLAVKGRNPIISKTMPIGGVFMLTGWTSLIFA